MTAKDMFSHRVSILTGHYGTGKTEVSVNLALALAAEGEQVMLADLDIVNPYFRSRERRPLLEKAGVRVISSSQACSDADVPALPAELLTILENREIRGILDIGGDPVGARVLARFQPKIVQEDTHLCGETTPAEIRKGVALAQEVSRQTGIPILCHTAERRFLESLSDLGEPVFPIAINMKKPWER